MNIGEHPFEWSKSEGRYGYLSKDDSELFDITECETIKRLLLDKAKASLASHCASHY